jgi:subtilisin family serine protease
MRRAAALACGIALVLATASGAGADTAPNDPLFGSEWGLDNTGQTVHGVTGAAGADISALDAWSITTGVGSPVVVVLDSGIDLSDTDLAPALWTNPGGIGGCPAGTHGYDVVPASPTCDPSDDNGHGTHVAGILGAVGNDGFGVSGVDPRVMLLPVKFMNATGKGTNRTLRLALDWILTIVQQGVDVRVVNESGTWPTMRSSSNVRTRLNELASAGILFVTAAGNSGSDNDTTPRYPCSYGTASEVCVAATDQHDDLWLKSNYGADSVDLTAPGVNIVSDLPGDTFGYKSGGSMAAAFVSGTAALGLAQQPGLSVADLRARLLDSVDVLPSLNGLVRTSGRLDACAALTGCPLPPA